MATITWTEEAPSAGSKTSSNTLPLTVPASPQAQLTVFLNGHKLATFPEIGHRYAASSRHVRVLLYGHYRIVYLVKDEGNIDILGVYHGSLDITKYQL